MRVGAPGPRRLVAAMVTALTALAVAAPAPPAGAAGSTAPVAAGGSLAADRAAFTALSYAGTVDVSSAGGTTAALRLDASAASFAGLALHGPCEDAGPARVSWEADAGAATSGPLSLLATSVTGTLDGATVTWSPQSPPPAGPLGDVVLSGATVALARLSAPALRTSGMRLSAAFCAG